MLGNSVNAGGALQLAAGIKETAALTVSSSALSLGATGDVLIGGVQENHVIDNASHHELRSVFTKSSGRSIDYTSSSTPVGSSVGGGTVSVKSGNDKVVIGSPINAQKDLTLVVGHDLVVTSGLQSVDENHSAESKKSGFSLKPAAQGFNWKSMEHGIHQIMG